jgi:hypothetical protein
VVPERDPAKSVVNLNGILSLRVRASSLPGFCVAKGLAFPQQLSQSPLSFGRFDGLANWSGLGSALPMTQGYPPERHGLSMLHAIHGEKGEEGQVRPKTCAILQSPGPEPRKEPEIQAIAGESFWLKARMTARSGEGLGVMSVTNRNLLSVNLLSCQLGDTATAQPALVCRSTVRASARELLPLLADRSPSAQKPGWTHRQCDRQGCGGAGARAGKGLARFVHCKCT